MSFYSIQMLSSVIPGISTCFIAIVTMVRVDRSSVSPLEKAKRWGYFSLVVLLFFALLGMVDNLGIPEQYKILETLLAGGLCLIPNYLLICIQKKCDTKE